MQRHLEVLCVLASFRRRLEAEAFAPSVDKLLNVGVAGKIGGLILRQFITGDTSAVTALCGHELLPFVTYPMDGDPVLHLEPFPLDHNVTNRGMLRK